jgi:hypothetical protein
MSIPQKRQAVDEINKLPQYNPPKIGGETDRHTISSTWFRFYGGTDYEED